MNKHFRQLSEVGNEGIESPFYDVSCPFHFTIVYILERFPSPTEHFIINELLELEDRGVELKLLVLRKQKKYLDMPELKKLKSPVFFLPGIYYYFPFIAFFFRPLSMLRSVKVDDVLSALKSPVTGLKQIRDFCISHYFAYKLKKYSGISHIHAHFAFIAVDIARTLSKILKVKYSVTVHAQDIYADSNKIEQISSQASFIITCTKYNGHYLHTITDSRLNNKLFTVYHGIDIEKWTNGNSTRRFKDSVIHILSIARLVEKKGLIYLLKAVQLLLSQGHKVKCTIIGEGPLRYRLKHYIEGNRMGDTVEILDFMSQEEIKDHLSSSDVFILPCIIAQNGDMDGLPNVILEAMISGVPVISTPVSAIPEVIKDGETGLLVKEKDENVLAESILALKNDPILYERLSGNACKKVRREFAIEECTNTLLEVFTQNIWISV